MPQPAARAVFSSDRAEGRGRSPGTGLVRILSDERRTEGSLECGGRRPPYFLAPHPSQIPLMTPSLFLESALRYENRFPGSAFKV
jgi:hypothetical protein